MHLEAVRTDIGPMRQVEHKWGRTVNRVRDSSGGGSSGGTNSASFCNLCLPSLPQITYVEPYVTIVHVVILFVVLINESQ